jgi:acyl-CoA thioesterase
MEQKSSFENKLSHSSRNDGESVIMEMVEAIVDNNSNENNLESFKSRDENAQQQQEMSQVKSRDFSQKRGKIKIQIYSVVNLKYANSNLNAHSLKQTSCEFSLHKFYSKSKYLSKDLQSSE